MRKATMLTLLLGLVLVGTTTAQETEFVLDVPITEDFKEPFRKDIQSGSRAISGPFDLDGDGKMEVLVADYTGGGRAHLLENTSDDTWEHVYSTPWLDSTATTAFNARYVYGVDAANDLDGDGRGEIIVPTGRNFSATNPDYDTQGLYIFEYTGTDDDYGDAPASILELEDRVYIQGGIEVGDFDNDGTTELLFGNNASANDEDKWYIYSVSGDIGSGIEVWLPEMEVPSRPDHGGGSPWAAFAPDFNGDGTPELLLHSWNNYNFNVGTVTGANTYSVPGSKNLAVYPANDAVAYAGGTVIDINGDGDDEVFLNNSLGGEYDDAFTLTVINYESGEDVTSITADQVITGLADDFIWGVTAGDLDNDGMPEVIGVGSGYSNDVNAGEPSSFIRLAEFVGGTNGDPEDPNNYKLYDIDTWHPSDTAGYDIVFRDSAGTMSRYFEEGSNDIFAFRAAYLGDVDGDGDNAVAISFQSVRDSIWHITETWDATNEVYDRDSMKVEAAVRPFARIISGDGFSVNVERIVLPTDYELFANYPNPFNPSTTIGFKLPVDKRVSVKVFDVTGRLVRTLVNDQFYSQGTYEVTWDGRSDAGMQVASGTYLYTLEYGNFRQSKTMVLLK